MASYRIPEGLCSGVLPTDPAAGSDAWPCCLCVLAVVGWRSGFENSVMFRFSARVRAARLGSSPWIADNQAVRTAEAIVGRAWAEELLHRRDRLEFEVSAAYEDCAAAHRCLAAAQHDGDPRAISLSHGALERALAIVCASVLARDQELPELHAQVVRLARITRERMALVLVHQPDYDESRIATNSEGTADPRRVRARAEPVSWQRVWRWFGRLRLRLRLRSALGPWRS